MNNLIFLADSFYPAAHSESNLFDTLVGVSVGILMLRLFLIILAIFVLFTILRRVIARGVQEGIERYIYIHENELRTRKEEINKAKEEEIANKHNDTLF